jgi:hypothetical protein
MPLGRAGARKIPSMFLFSDRSVTSRRIHRTEQAVTPRAEKRLGVAGLQAYPGRIEAATTPGRSVHQHARFPAGDLSVSASNGVVDLPRSPVTRARRSRRARRVRAPGRRPGTYEELMGALGCRVIADSCKRPGASASNGGADRPDDGKFRAAEQGVGRRRARRRSGGARRGRQRQRDHHGEADQQPTVRTFRVMGFSLFSYPRRASEQQWFVPYDGTDWGSIHTGLTEGGSPCARQRQTGKQQVTCPASTTPCALPDGRCSVRPAAAKRLGSTACGAVGSGPPEWCTVAIDEDAPRRRGVRCGPRAALGQVGEVSTLRLANGRWCPERGLWGAPAWPTGN